MTTSYCVIGCTRGTGLQIARQLAECGAPVLGIARDPAKARDLLPAAVEIRAGDVTDPGSLRAAQLGACRAMFFAVDITGGIGGRGFFKPAGQIRAVTYEGLVNVVDAARAAAFTGRFVLLSGMGSELPSRASSATASGLPDAALGTVSPGRNEDLPVPAQEMCVHAQGLKTTRGGQDPCDDGPVPVAFCLPRRHRHPGLHCFRRSIPRLYAPLSTLRVLPHGSDPRMTRGQCGSLLLHCNGLSPSTSCRSSRRTAARYLARGLPCERFTSALAGRRASLGVGVV